MGSASSIEGVHHTCGSVTAVVIGWTCSGRGREVAEMSAEPTQLWNAPRCGAKTRGARGGRPCRSPAMANGRCRMHGGLSGGPTGSRNGAYKHGRYTKRTKELGALMRKL